MTISAGPTRFTNNPTTTLNGNIDSSQTTVGVLSATGFPNPGPYRVLLENEQMEVVGGYGTVTWTVIRGVDGTAAAAHTGTPTIYHNVTAFNFNSFRAEFNPLAYLAVGNGVADDSTPFQNAINDAHALTGGGHIYLPDLPFKINSTLTTYANVVFITHGAVLSGTGAASVTPLIRFSQLGGLTLPAALVVSSGGANITGGIVVSGTTTFNAVAYTWPGSAGTNTYVLTTNGSGTLSWAASGGGAVSSVAGTAGQISVSPTTGAAIVSLPSGGTLPGAWTAASGFTVTTGGLIVSAGGLVVSANGANIVGGITGTISTPAQTNITSLGTLVGLAVTYNAAGNNVPILPSSQAGGTGIRIWVQTADPGVAASDGDIWVKG